MQDHARHLPVIPLWPGLKTACRIPRRVRIAARGRLQHNSRPFPPPRFPLRLFEQRCPGPTSFRVGIDLLNEQEVMALVESLPRIHIGHDLQHADDLRPLYRDVPGLRVHETVSRSVIRCPEIDSPILLMTRRGPLCGETLLLQSCLEHS